MDESEQAAGDRLTLPASAISRGSARSLLFRVITAGSDFLLVVVTARGLGAEGRGLYSLASLTAFVMVTILSGCCTSLAAEYAHGRALLGELYAASLAIAALSAILIPVAITVDVLTSSQLGSVLVYGAAATPFLSLLVFQLALYQAQGDVRRLQYVYLLKSVLSLVVLAAVAVAAPGRPYLFLTIWATVQAIVPLGTLRVQGHQARFVWRRSRALIARLLRRGAPVSVAKGIALLNVRIDLIAVAALLPLADVGRYSVATAMSEGLWLLSSAVLTGAYSAIVRASVDASVQITLRAFRHTVVLMVVGALLELLAARVLLSPVFGPSFASIWLPLALLMPGIVASALADILQPFFLVRLERNRDFIVMASGGMAINLTLAFALIPYLGLNGAAISTSVSYLCGAAYILIRFTDLAGIRAANYLPGRSEVGDYRRLFASLLSDRVPS